MNRRSNIVFLFLIGMFALLLGGCSSSGGDGTTTTPPLPQFYFKASNTNAVDAFGKTVALSGDGNTLAIGAWGEDSNGTGGELDDSASAAGAVYVFRRSVVGDTVSWNQVAYVKAPTPVTSENLGYSVSLSLDGNKLAVGAPDILGGSHGKVYVYIGPNYDTTPDVIDTTDLSVGYANGDRFGEAVALSDDGFRLVIGAPGYGATDTGAVYIFEDVGNANSWAQEGSRFVPTADSGAGFGVSVALNQDGSVLAAGAWLEDDTGSNEGAVYSYTRSGTTWTAVTKLLASTPVTDDRFGTAVSLSDDGTQLAVGAPGDFEPTGGTSGSNGSVYVYTGNVIPVTTWSSEQIVTASNPDADDAFGLSVMLSSNGTKLLVGASYEDGSGSDIGTPDTVNAASNAGAAYYFVGTASWTQESYIKATNTDGGDQFGASVTMDNSGNRVVIGAIGEASDATGVNGDQSINTLGGAGAAYLWNL